VKSRLIKRISIVNQNRKNSVRRVRSPPTEGIKTCSIPADDDRKHVLFVSGRLIAVAEMSGNGEIDEDIQFRTGNSFLRRLTVDRYSTKGSGPRSFDKAPRSLPSRQMFQRISKLVGDSNS
jgi:hypothetical protein